MGPPLYDSAIFQYQYEVRAPDSGEPVGDGDDSTASGKFRNRLLDLAFGFNVNRRGCFVQNNDGRVAQDCSGYGDTLFLTA